jgi:hypothetical protein
MTTLDNILDRYDCLFEDKAFYSWQKIYATPSTAAIDWYGSN